MNIDLIKLINGTEELVSFAESIRFNEEELRKIEILNIKNCKASGFIKRYSEDLYNINMNIKGTMILECSVSLEEVEYPFDIKIDETFSQIDENDEENLKINANILDIFPIIWENIVLEKPARVVKKDNHAVTKGTGWSLTEKIEKTSNSQLSELNKLLDMEERK